MKTDFVSLLHDAQAIVRASSLYGRFIDGTPLSNDIAVWMAEFAHARIREIGSGNQSQEQADSTRRSAAQKTSSNSEN